MSTETPANRGTDYLSFDLAPESFTWSYSAGTKTIRAEPTNYWLASMDSWDGAVKSQTEANARLIASAPDLLAALKWYVQNMVWSDECEGDQADFDAAYEAGCAAIAKAEGSDLRAAMARKVARGGSAVIGED